ncbi:MAG: glycerophosphodiester phosphodiesterase family protein [Deltaproteobacteria bacterium]|nr:glycerophosphodiester phosphodiesterase family protein [Deltaproteobacteria bacterium]
MSRPLIIAHRGVNKSALENSIPAFRKAIDMGCDGIEMDVRLTRDNKVVVFHDEDLKRIFNIDESVKDISYENLKRVTDDKIPLLVDVLPIVRNMRFINIELKVDGKFSGVLEELVLKLVGQFDIYERVLFSSFNPLSIGLIKRLKKNARTAFLFAKDASYKELVSPIATLLGCEAVNPQFNIINEFMMLHYKEWGLKVYVWTVDKRENILEMMKLGVDGIITNRPDLALKVRVPKRIDKPSELDPKYWEED